MTRLIISWWLRRQLSPHLSAERVEQIIAALFDTYAEIRAKGDKAVVYRPAVATGPVVIGPDRPVTVDDIISGRIG